MKKNYFFFIILFTLFNLSSKSQIIFLDPDFGDNGLVIDSEQGKNYRVSDLKIYNNSIFICGGIRENNITKPTLNKYFLNGTIDNSFGIQGILRIDSLLDFNISAGAVKEIILLPSEDKILLNLGTTENNMQNNYILKIFTDGSVDESFGEMGYFKYTLSGPEDFGFSETRLLSDGSLLMIGSNSNIGKIYKLQNNGTLDTTFGSNGILTTEFSDAITYRDFIVNDNSIYIVGREFNGIHNDVLIQKISIDGELDQNFGDNGIVNIDINGTNDYASSLVSINDSLFISGGTELLTGGFRGFTTIVDKFSGLGNNIYNQIFIDDYNTSTFLVKRAVNNVVVAGLYFSNTLPSNWFLRFYDENSTLLSVEGAENNIISVELDGTLQIGNIDFDMDQNIYVGGYLLPSDLFDDDKLVIAKIKDQSLILTNTRLEEFQENITIKVYPNPTYDDLTIEFSEYQKLYNFELKLRNSTGTQLRSISKENFNGIMNLPLNGLAPGIYYLEIYNSEQKRLSKLVTFLKVK